MRYLIISAVILSFNVLFSQTLKQRAIHSGELYQSALNSYDNELLFETELKINEILNTFPQGNSELKSKLLDVDLDIKSGNYANGIAKLNDLLKTNNNSPYKPVIHFKLGVIYFEQNRYDWAEQSFKEAKLESRKSFAFLKDSSYLELAHISNYREAVSIANKGSYADSKEVFEEIIESKDKGEYTDDAIFSLGQTAESFHRYDDAIEFFRKVRLEYPTSNSYLRSLIREANNHLSRRDANSAVSVLEKANTLWSDLMSQDSLKQIYEKQTGMMYAQEQILYLRGEAGCTAGNFEDGLTFFNSFLETFSNSKLQHHVYLGAGWAHLNLKNFNKAIEYYDKVIESSNDEFWKAKAIAQLYKVVALKRKGDIISAQREMAALSVRSDYPYLGEVLLELGQMYYEQQEWEMAQRTLERADRESSDVVSTVKIKLLLGSVYLQIAKWDKAVEVYDKAEDFASNTNRIIMPQKDWYLNEARYKRGIAYIRSGRTSMAIPSLAAFIAEENDTLRKSEAMFWLAESYYRADMIKNAEQAYAALLDQYPRTRKREDALYGLGWSYFRQERFSTANKYFSVLVDEYPQSDYAIEVIVRQADGNYKTKNYSRAAQLYDNVSKRAPNTNFGEYSAYQICHSYYRMGEWDNAINQLFNFVRRYRDSQLAPNAMYLIGWIRFQQKKYDEAIDNFNFLIEAFPNSGYVARTYYNIGDAYYNQQKFEDAIKFYRTVVESYPTSSLAPEALNGVNDALVLLGREKEAIDLINAYSGKNDDSPFVYDFRTKAAKIHRESGQYSEAIKEYEDLIKKFPNKKQNAEAIYWIGRSYISMSEPIEAQKAFDRLIEKFPQSEYAPMSMLSLGMMFKELNDPVLSDSVLLNLEQKYPESREAPQAGFERALMAYTMGDTLKSFQIYKHVADDYPYGDFSIESRYRLGMYYRKNNKIDSAITEFAKLAENDYDLSRAAEAQYTIGELWKKEKNFELAIEAFETVREKYSGFEDWFSLSLLNLGELYENKEEWLKAREVYNILIELRPEDDFGKTASRRQQRVLKNLPDETE